MPNCRESHVEKSCSYRITKTFYLGEFAELSLEQGLRLSDLKELMDGGLVSAHWQPAPDKRHSVGNL